MRKSILALLFAGAFGTAHAGFIDFEPDTAGPKPNGWMSVQSNILSFYDSNGSGLEVQDWAWQSYRHGLAVFDDFDDSHLIIQANQDLKYLCLSFGNDDPLFSNAGDLAVLTAYKGANLVAQTAVVMNRNDNMDQTIAVSYGGGFDSLTFKYEVNPQVGLIEIVDNICFEPVPEPGSIAALGLGLLALRRRRA